MLRMRLLENIRHDMTESGLNEEDNYKLYYCINYTSLMTEYFAF